MPFVRFLTAFFLLGASLDFVAEAHEPFRIFSIDEFGPGLRSQAHYRAPNAKVAWADFALLRNDFPALRLFTDGAIENWILDQFAYVSEMQLKLRGIRTSDFAVGAEKRIFFHPPTYFRAAVAEAQVDGKSVGLVDLKGSGQSNSEKTQKQLAEFEALRKQFKEGSAEFNQAHDVLKIRDHSDGVASLGELVSEVSKQQAIQAAYAAGITSGESVESYFLVDLGFDVLKDGDQRIPAGVIGRQPHLRAKNFRIDSGETGFTGDPRLIYSDDYGHFQRTISGSSIDFGGAIVTLPEVSSFFAPISSDVTNDAQMTKSWADSHDAARLFREESGHDLFAARGKIYRYLESTLGSLRLPWLKNRKFAEGTHAQQLDELLAAVHRGLDPDVAIAVLEKRQLWKLRGFADRAMALVRTSELGFARPSFLRIFNHFGAEFPQEKAAVRQISRDALTGKRGALLTTGEAGRLITELGWDSIRENKAVLVRLVEYDLFYLTPDQRRELAAQVKAAIIPGSRSSHDLKLTNALVGMLSGTKPYERQDRELVEFLSRSGWANDPQIVEILKKHESARFAKLLHEIPDHCAGWLFPVIR